MQANFRNSRRIALFPVLLIFCLFGCHSDDIPRILRDVATLPEITGVPEEVQILIWDDRETLLAKLAAAEADAAAEYPTLPDGYLEVIRQKICRLDEQRRYYTKYIDAGGITVIGSASVTDREFYSVRDIILRMTAKRPELRKLLSPSGGSRVILVSAVYSGTIGETPEFTCFGHTPREPGGFASGRFQSMTLIGVCCWDVFVHEFAHQIHGAIRCYHPLHFQNSTLQRGDVENAKGMK